MGLDKFRERWYAWAAKEEYDGCTWSILWIGR